MRGFTGFFLAAAVALPATVGAQVAVSQGMVSQGMSVYDLHSPAIFNGSFPLTDRRLWGTGGWFGWGDYTDPALYQAWYAYHCDGVAIVKFRMRGKPDGDQLKVELNGRYYNDRSGHDKKVHLLVEILKGSQVVASDEAEDKVEESDHATFGLDLTLPQSVVETAPAPILRLTMRTVDY